ncbi:hypothetical protein [Variovorax sp. J22R115]|uniref:hypothetical protein n=1 Tax=Variovorax sp. J22R115 TaxID=3053509 RepID=UPI0025764705|nr:hypothetical protein [Variovorax sp. J22R115]MDM0047938.1 hypothetical protein [Variovorax sp. J22R115]
MLNSTVLEVAIGLVFCFASVSLITSQINEAISSFLGLRARGLLQGIKELLNDKKFNSLALAIYRHSLANPLGSLMIGSEKDLKSKPSYMEPLHFAQALLDSVQTNAVGAGKNGLDLAIAIDHVGDPQIRGMLAAMYRRANGRREAIETQLSAWFDSGMERVAGTYKRRTQAVSFVIGLAVAAALNIDSVGLFSAIWARPAYTAQISAGAGLEGQALSSTVETMAKLPVGWTTDRLNAFDLQDARTWQQVAGWLLTALSVLFGAPFWFDALQKLVQLRGTGKKPGEGEKDDKDG